MIATNVALTIRHDVEISYKHDQQKPHEVSQHEKYRQENLRKTLEHPDLNNDKITLEIGCGHGRFLSAYAKSFHENLCIGIDLVAKRLRACEQKKSRMQLSNLFFIKAKAEEFIEVFPPDKKLSEIFILFPDPWPKRRHYKNRLIQDDFLQKLAKLCNPGAKIFFRTDHQEYFNWTYETFKKNENFILISETEWHFEHNTVFQDLAENYNSLIAEVKQF